ncbi:ParB/Srx family N-terminal domain-containing protein [Erwinia aphidicola]|uniref:ParB/Srx family N-terminal domain-containing protein n=1 Tax=Erwinia aphidicola TaxID=68334 RepID=UPI0030CDBAEB
MDIKQLKPKIIEKVSPDLLSLDPRNPRLYNGKNFSENAEVADLVKELANSADLEELIQSISENGYLSIEPLIIMLRKNKYIVLEGNRRLAAIKLLKDPDLARKCRVVVPKKYQLRFYTASKK